MFHVKTQETFNTIRAGLLKQSLRQILNSSNAGTGTGFVLVAAGGAAYADDVVTKLDGHDASRAHCSFPVDSVDLRIQRCMRSLQATKSIPLLT